MITIKDFMEIVNYKISEGTEYTWDCYGPNAYILDYWDGNQDGYNISIIYDTKTQEVYQLDACDYKNSRAYRWLNPDYVKAFREECELKMPDKQDQAWDEVYYADIDVEEDIISKAKAIAEGQEYDTRITVPLDLSRDELFDIMYAAHEKDMTVNQYIENVLRRFIVEEDILEK